VSLRERTLGRLRRLLDDLRANEGGPSLDWRTLFVLLVTPVLLTVFFYWGRPDYYRAVYFEWGLERFGVEWPYQPLLPYAYWAASSLVLRVLLPIAFVWFVLRHRLRDYGWRIRGTGRHVAVYFGLLLFMLPFLYFASLRESFQQKYPFYGGASLGGWHFWGFQICYFIQFFSLEAFFRGFMLFGLRQRFGYYSVLIMVVPYCMIHFGKPVPETLGAIVAGLVLGVLALRSGSFYLGVIVHYAVALLMDVLALYQTGRLDNVF
jgi:uncharacterized protein